MIGPWLSLSSPSHPMERRGRDLSLSLLFSVLLSLFGGDVRRRTHGSMECIHAILQLRGLGTVSLGSRLACGQVSVVEYSKSRSCAILLRDVG